MLFLILQFFWLDNLCSLFKFQRFCKIIFHRRNEKKIIHSSRMVGRILLFIIATLEQFLSTSQLTVANITWLSVAKGKGSLCNRPRGSRGEIEVQRYSFFNLGARWGGWPTPRHRPLYARERPGTHCIGWVEISPPTGIRSPDRPACSESLYRLSYRVRLSVGLLSNLENTFIKFFSYSRCNISGQC